MTCYYIENAHKERRTYDSYVPVEQMGEVLTSAMLQTAVRKFGEGEFTRKQFDELREEFRTKKTERRFDHFYDWCYDKRIRWYDVDFGEYVAPMCFDTLKERGIFDVERFENFEIETEDGTITAKRNYYTLNLRKVYRVIDEMGLKFEVQVRTSRRTVEKKVNDLRNQLEVLKQKLEGYEAILKMENEGRLPLVSDSHPHGMVPSEYEKEFDKYVDAVIKEHAA